jgi:hypothetical protein
LEAWHQFVCRYGQTGIGNNLSTLGWDSIIRTYLEEDQSCSLSPAQLETLQRCRGAATVLIDARRGASLDYTIEGAVVLTPIAGWRGVAVGVYLAYDTDWLWQQCGDPAAVIADLSQVHYPELALPECMKKYEALTSEEVRRRNAARREKEKREREAQAAAAKAQAGDAER